MNIMDCGYAGELGLVSYIESIHGKLSLGFVRELFLHGMSTFSSTDFGIVETYRCSGASMQARLELFQTQVGITKEIHGDANVRYAWLPFPEGELSTMVECGLGYCMLSAANCTYDTGVLLAAVTCPYASARYCDIDKNDVRHLVLCRVIMGNMELLRPSIGTGTRQFQPISSKYDNGVDDFQSPKYYLVWNMNINTHIYPEFIISFKVNEDAKGHFCGIVGDRNLFGANSYGHGSSGLLESASLVDNGLTSGRVSSIPNIPKSPWLPFSMLIAALSDKVDANDMSLIREHYELYKVKQVSRDDLVKVLRLIVGDTILRATITSLQFKIPSLGE
ncbi:inactive poly [ADP-ribose] polymerase RCD1-like [Lotus japonicus]|uniref:inactive poly [ADP-ribose] polymerase RCD1-like n=1 Tax=Lotus japonicus TaxID=34305 RepID=UPI002588FF6C|nr:inactive poly [ADP-ribose] polymerase RCD1-like [Lotus japonicus]